MIISFADNSLFINCGGPKLKEEGHEYDEDNSTSTFGKDRDGKWVYTCSGDFLSTTSNASDYLKNMTCGVSENSLYRTGRLCPVALSYYAFCLHDDQYNVTLHFAETVYTKEEDYSSVGKRIFDVYIQVLGFSFEIDHYWFTHISTMQLLVLNHRGSVGKRILK